MAFFSRLKDVIHGLETPAEDEVVEEEVEVEEAEEEAAAIEVDPEEIRPDIEDVGKGTKVDPEEERPDVEEMIREKTEATKKTEENKAEETEAEENKAEEAEAEEGKAEESARAVEPKHNTRAWTINGQVLQVFINEDVGYKLLSYKEAYILADELAIPLEMIVFRDCIPWETPNGVSKWVPRGDGIQTLDEYIADLRKSQLPQIPDAQDVVEAYIALDNGTVSITRRGQTVTVDGVPANNGTKKFINPVTWALGEKVLAKITPCAWDDAGTKRKGFDPCLYKVTITDGSITKIARDETPNYLGDFVIS